MLTDQSEVVVDISEGGFSGVGIVTAVSIFVEVQLLTGLWVGTTCVTVMWCF